MSSSLWPMDCIPPGSSILEIFQARILEWAAISFSKVSSRSREWNFHLLGLLHWQGNFLLLCHLGSPVNSCKLQKEKCWGVINARRAEGLNSLTLVFELLGLESIWGFVCLGFVHLPGTAMACRILVPLPGIEPRPQQWPCQVLTTESPGNSPLTHTFLLRGV